VKSAQGRLALNVVQTCVTGTMFCALLGCAMMDATKSDLSVAHSPGVGDQVRGLDLSPRFPTTVEDTTTRDPSQPLLFPGAENDPEPQQDQNSYTRVASAQPGAVLVGQGVEMNFEGAEIKTVAKTLLGDVLKLNVLVDPRVQGNVTLASAGAIPRKDVLSAFESVLRMSNAAIVREGNLVKIVPLAEAGSNAAVSVGAGQPGFGVSIVRTARNRPLDPVSTSASTAGSEPASFSASASPSRTLMLVALTGGLSICRTATFPSRRYFTAGTEFSSESWMRNCTR